MEPLREVGMGKEALTELPAKLFYKGSAGNIECIISKPQSRSLKRNLSRLRIAKMFKDGVSDGLRAKAIVALATTPIDQWDEGEQVAMNHLTRIYGWPGESVHGLRARILKAAKWRQNYWKDRRASSEEVGGYGGYRDLYALPTVNRSHQL
jgi:hypothetical protein